MFNFSGKTAVVTGGANGIGLATARALAAQNAQVWILDLAREDPANVAASIGQKGVIADVTSRESLEAALAQTGPPDIVIASAGTALENEITEVRKQDWDRIIDVNLTGVFQTVQTAAVYMKPRRCGSIVMIASTNSFDGEARLTAYNASKAGLLGILHTASNELGPFGIRVNAVCPGLIRTRLTQAHFSSPSILENYFRGIPLGRGGEPDEVAHAVVFLASDFATYITGSTLFVDGGQMAAKFGPWNETMGEFRNGRWFLK